MNRQTRAHVLGSELPRNARSWGLGGPSLAEQEIPVVSLQPGGGQGKDLRSPGSGLPKPVQTAAEAAAAPVHLRPLIRRHRAVPSILPRPRRAALSGVFAVHKRQPFARCIHRSLLPQGQPHGASLSALQVNRGFCVRQGTQSRPTGDPAGSRYASPARASGGHSLRLLSTPTGGGGSAEGGLSGAPREGHEREGRLEPRGVLPAGWQAG